MIGFDWFSQDGVKGTLSLIYTIVDVIRIIVPIVLIVMTTIDITKKIIDPNEKEGQKKIMIRTIAAIIVFFIPTLINFVFDLMDIDIQNIDIDTNPSGVTTPKPTIKPTITPVPTPNTNYLDKLSITNCPSKLLHNGDNITLDTNIPSTYTGEIKWRVNSGEKYINLKGGVSSSTKVEISNIEIDATAMIQIEAGGKTDSCLLNLQSDRLSSIDITNCPRSSETYIIGSKVELKTDIPSSFKGKVEWSVNDDTVVKFTETGSKNTINVNLMTRPSSGVVWVTVKAGGVSKTCYINIKAVDELKITNCPSENQKFHIGDKILLKSNLPPAYNGNTVWQSSTTDGVFRFTPSSDGREAEVLILKIPETKYGHLALGADAKSATCTIYFE